MTKKAENIYDSVIATMDKLPEENRKIFFQFFWSTMDREEKIVFTMDAMASMKESGLLKDFMKDLNEEVAKKQDAILDDYITQKISKEEFIKKMEATRKIETQDK